MVNIAQSFGGIPVYFIRWNPDDYCPFNDNKKTESVNNRHKSVGNVIKEIMDKRRELPKDSLVSVMYMYFDDWDGLPENPWISLLKLEN